MKLIIFFNYFTEITNGVEIFGGGTQSVCHQPQEPALVDWPTHDFRQLYQFCQ